MSIHYRKESSSFEQENQNKRTAKTVLVFKLATSALVDKQRNAALSYDPRYPEKTELRKSPQLTVSTTTVVKPWVIPAPRAALVIYPMSLMCNTEIVLH